MFSNLNLVQRDISPDIFKRLFMAQLFLVLLFFHAGGCAKNINCCIEKMHMSTDINKNLLQ